MCKCKKYKAFTFRFDIYNGSESSFEIYDEQVVQYEFINQGTTICIIGNGLQLYPAYTGIEPSRMKLDIMDCERDVTIYPYSFAPVDFILKSLGDASPYSGDIVTKFYLGLPESIPEAPPNFNQLLVISKVKASTGNDLGAFTDTEICEECGK